MFSKNVGFPALAGRSKRQRKLKE